MDQKVTAMQGSSPIPGARHNGSGHWGQWFGAKRYSLEVVQNPLRARMCGFGDKDRRPLAPAAIARMIVQRTDHTIVDVDQIDCSFFLVAADLWSEDGTQDLNLVMHPSAEGRCGPPHAPRPKRRGTANLTAQQCSRQETPTASQSSSISSPIYSIQSPSAEFDPTIPYDHQSYTYAHLPSSAADLQFKSFSHTPPVTNQDWAYSADRGLPAVALHSSGRGASSSTGSEAGDAWQHEHTSREGPEMMAYRSWPADPSYLHTDCPSNQAVYGTSSMNPSPTDSHSPKTDVPWMAQWVPPTGDLTRQSRYEEALSAGLDSTQLDSPVYSPYPPNATQSHRSGIHVQNTSIVQLSSSTIRHSLSQPFVRTLVGPLTSNARRLHDDYENPGIFFIFQDLSVRIEGKFRLRLRLMNVGAPPAPDTGALRVHTNVSPVLAQTFTEPFVVYSAKKFPGVAETTPLSIAFGNQGQKLPLRNRHGPGRQGRQQLRGESYGSDGDSDVN